MDDIDLVLQIGKKSQKLRLEGGLATVNALRKAVIDELNELHSSSHGAERRTMVEDALVQGDLERLFNFLNPNN